MKLVVGLGNPGKGYKNTRHNVGFMVLDILRSSMGLEDFKYSRKFNADIVKNTKFVLLKSKTYMNNSGDAVLKCINFFKIKVSDIIVVHDDIDFDLGVIKIAKDESSAGHNGVKSIIDRIDNKSFFRVRVGIFSSEKGRKKTEDFVLEPFLSSERGLLEKTLSIASEEVENILKCEEIVTKKIKA